MFVARGRRSRALRALWLVCLLAGVAAPVASASTAAAAPADWLWAEPGHAQRLSVLVTPDADASGLFAVAAVDFSAAFAQAGAGANELDQSSLVVHEVDDGGAVLDPCRAVSVRPRCRFRSDDCGDGRVDHRAGRFFAPLARRATSSCISIRLRRAHPGPS